MHKPIVTENWMSMTPMQALIVYVLMIWDSILKGAALSVIWNWLIVPTLPVPPLMALGGAGIMCVVWFVGKSQDVSGLAVTWKLIGKLTSDSLGKCIVYLVLAFIIRLLMGG